MPASTCLSGARPSTQITRTPSCRTKCVSDGAAPARPHADLGPRSLGFSYSITSTRYGDEWRKRRRAFHCEFHPGVVSVLQPMQLRKSRAFVGAVLQRPTGACVLSRECVPLPCPRRALPADRGLDDCACSG